MRELSVDDQITFIYCDDLARTAAFYEDLLGFELVVDQGSCRIVRVAGNGGYLGYCARGAGESASRGIILTLVTDQVDEWYEYLLGCGLSLQKPPESSPEFGIYHFFFHDPDGYQLEIQRFEDREWNREADR